MRISVPIDLQGLQGLRRISRAGFCGAISSHRNAGTIDFLLQQRFSGKTASLPFSGVAHRGYAKMNFGDCRA